jgi:hypothetical protein
MVTQSSKERLTPFDREIRRRILEPDYKNDLRWGVRHKQELTE